MEREATPTSETPPKSTRVPWNKGKLVGAKPPLLELGARSLDLVLSRAFELGQGWLTLPPVELREFVRAAVQQVAVAEEQIVVRISRGMLATWVRRASSNSARICRSIGPSSGCTWASSPDGST